MPTKAPADSAQMQRKTAVIDDIKARLESADAAVLTEYRGLTVSDIANLRAALRPAATDYKIFKNTLARRAAHDAGLDDIVESLEGPVAIAFVRRDGGDAVTAAKALRDFARTNPNLVLKGGILGPRLLTRRRHRGARRRPAPRPVARPLGRWLPGPDGQGGRPVPGVHPQHGVRRQGADRPADRGWRGARRSEPEPEAPAGRGTRGRGRRPRPRPRPRLRPQKRPSRNKHPKQKR